MRLSRVSTYALAIALFGALAQVSTAATIGLAANVRWQSSPGGGNATVTNGTNVNVDSLANPFLWIDIAVTSSEGDHQGVSQVVYNVVSQEAKSKGYFLNAADRTSSGYNNFGGPASVQTVLAAAYDSPQPSVPPANYSGGWGWTNSGLPHGGNTLGNPGSVIGAGDSLPLTWSGDNAPLIPGIQSFARIGVGQGAYTSNNDDGALADGTQQGFGYDVVNQVGTGDGSWWFHSILIDTTGWDKQTYTFTLTTTAGNVLNSNADLSQPLGGGFRQAVVGSDLQGTTISFTLIPEPGTLGLVLMGGLALIRRRR
jgi:hypothetical protein